MGNAPPADGIKSRGLGYQTEIPTLVSPRVLVCDLFYEVPLATALMVSTLFDPTSLLNIPYEYYGLDDESSSLLSNTTIQNFICPCSPTAKC